MSIYRLVFAVRCWDILFTHIASEILILPVNKRFDAGYIFKFFFVCTVWTTVHMFIVRVNIIEHLISARPSKMI